jgi:hypothetical protein
MLTFLFATVVGLLVVGALGYALTFRAEDVFLRLRERRAERQAESAPLVSGRVGLDH